MAKKVKTSASTKRRVSKPSRKGGKAPKRAKSSGKTSRADTHRKKTAKPVRATARKPQAKKASTRPSEAWPPPEDPSAHFEALELLRKVLVAQDMLFLSRQISYHVAAASELPHAWGDQQRIRQVLSRLIEHIVRRAPRRSNVAMALAPHSFRSEPGVEISMTGNDAHCEGLDVNAFMATLFSTEADQHSGIALSCLREEILTLRGRLWIDMPKPGVPIYHLLLPTTKDAHHARESAHHTFRYDIRIVNYANIRKRFGIRKSHSLVAQIEHYVRSLVRYPIDMVMSSTDKGTITTIYETQGGAASSVATRISQRLARETFHIGRKPVEVVFSYKLSTPESASREGNSARKRRA